MKIKEVQTPAPNVNAWYKRMHQNRNSRRQPQIEVFLDLRHPEPKDSWKRQADRQTKDQ